MLDDIDKSSSPWLPLPLGPPPLGACYSLVPPPLESPSPLGSPSTWCLLQTSTCPSPLALTPLEKDDSPLPPIHEKHDETWI